MIIRQSKINVKQVNFAGILFGELEIICVFAGTYFHKCDVIKQNQSEVGNIDFKIEPNKAENVFCFLSFVASFNCSYLCNQLTNFNGVFCKM